MIPMGQASHQAAGPDALPRRGAGRMLAEGRLGVLPGEIAAVRPSAAPEAGGSCPDTYPAKASALGQ